MTSHNNDMNGLYLPDSSSSDDLEKVRELMNSLLEIVGQNRQTRIDLENSAASILKHEHEKVQLLAKYAEMDPDEILNQKEDDKVNGESETRTLKGQTMEELIREKIKLQVELQEHNHISEESAKLMDSFKTALGYMKVLAEDHTATHNRSLEALETTLQQNVQREDIAYRDLQASHKELVNNMYYLNNSLQHANKSMESAIDQHQRQMKP